MDISCIVNTTLNWKQICKITFKKLDIILNQMKF